MHIVHYPTLQTPSVQDLANILTLDGFVWVAINRDAFDGNAELAKETLSFFAEKIHPLHWQEAFSKQHPSYFSANEFYAMLQVQGLHHNPDDDPDSEALQELPLTATHLQQAEHYNTSSLCFFVLPKMLLCFHATEHQGLIQALQTANTANHNHSILNKQRHHASSPEEFLVRSVHIITEQFSNLRPALNHLVDHWQHQLLDPRQRFNNWPKLLQTLSVLRMLEDHSEEQYDSIQAFHDFLTRTDISINDLSPESRLEHGTRLKDIKEHVSRTTHHTQRINDSLENTIQLYYSATANRTNDIMRVLTVITAFFLPLNLITGLFGMNFDAMPLISNPKGFIYTIIAMAVIVIGLWSWFLTRRYIEAQPYRALDKLRLTKLRQYQIGRRNIAKKLAKHKN